MRRKGRGSFILLTVLLIIVLVGCSKNDNHATHSVAEPIVVKLTVQPMEAQVGEKVKFTAKVTHQGVDVNDAKEVMFEYWKDGVPEEQHSKEIVTSSGEGTYVLEAVFQEPGDYEVISHVTAMDQHSMPSVKFTVK